LLKMIGECAIDVFFRPAAAAQKLDDDFVGCALGARRVNKLLDVAAKIHECADCIARLCQPEARDNPRSGRIFFEKIGIAAT